MFSWLASLFIRSELPPYSQQSEPELAMETACPTGQFYSVVTQSCQPAQIYGCQQPVGILQNWRGTDYATLIDYLFYPLLWIGYEKSGGLHRTSVYSVATDDCSVWRVADDSPDYDMLVRCVSDYQ